MRNSHLREHQEDKLVVPCDYVIKKPFHGSRLIEVMRLLPECKSTSQHSFRKLKMGSISQEVVQPSSDPNPASSKCLKVERGAATSSPYTSIEQTVLYSDGMSKKKPLSGKKILIVEDAATMIKLTTTRISKLGAKVEVCRNGKEAFDHVCKILSHLRMEGHSKTLLPYDYIIMDCEMPVMDGFEATRLIRKEEEE
ncbi:histidine kinase CKI1-like isoform X1 [Mangifera indica]|uniref:histidine kinase CKI1-like isoform X1 n=1 Tax=Mangifera indica TaxID=29780 RepID=UPI001CFBB81E|nr:histidine kinase CKI1-like isoform X1 [Mangifera indica]XP_044482924.1 histidine kinase CKI1-like isoform X1 [Mangifera indica]XP_044482925.1 histidine kinase CKI1-like isoform X1 [Mangifera indica]